MNWKPFFDYTRSEKRGIFVFITLVFILIAVQMFFLPTLDGWKMDSSDRRQLDQFQRSLHIYEKEKASSSKKWKKESSVNKKLKVSANFDPNTLSIQEWEAMGMSNRQAKIISNYLQKGGHFYKKEDLKKIYGISESMYQQMEPYITLEKKEKFPAKEPDYRKPKEKLSIAINTADAITLEQIYGVGPSYSKRIIEYRNKLGGFVHPTQLYEIWGFDSLTVEDILPHITIQSDSLRKININRIKTRELVKHPYINKRMAYAIIQYRQQNGKLKKLDELLQIKQVNQEFFIKIKPYLSLND